MELVQESDFSVTFTQDGFAQNSKPLPTPPQLWAVRQEALSIEDIKLRQRKLSDLCWLATVTRPDICARLARIASRVNSLQGSDVYRISDLATTVRAWRLATVLKYPSSSHMGELAEGDENGEMRKRVEKTRRLARRLVGAGREDSRGIHGPRRLVGCGLW